MTILYHHRVCACVLYHGYTIVYYAMGVAILYHHSVYDYVLYYGYTLATLQ